MSMGKDKTKRPGPTDPAGSIGGLRFSTFYGEKLEKSVVLSQDCIFIGRLLTAHLPVDDPKVSRMHAVVEIRDGKQVILTDLESSNGTRVNGQEEHVATLADGDAIEVGDSRIKVEFLTPEEVGALPSVVYQAPTSRGLKQQVGVDTVLLDAQEAAEQVELSTDEIDGVLGHLEPTMARRLKEGVVAGAKKTPATQEKRAEVSTRSPRLLRGMGTALELKVQWGEEILDIQHLDAPETVTVGKNRKNTYIIPPMEAYPATLPIISPLSEKRGGGFLLAFTGNMEGWVYTGERLQSLDELKKSPRLRRTKLEQSEVHLYPLSPSDKGMISIENLAFCFQTVRAFPRYHSPASKINKRPFWAGLTLYAAMIALFSFFPVTETEPTVAEQVEQTAAAVEVIYSRDRAKGFLEQLVSQELLQTGSPTGEVRGRAVTGITEKGSRRERRAGGETGKRGRPARRAQSAEATAGRKLAQALEAIKSDDITRVLGSSGFLGKGGGVGTPVGKGGSKQNFAPRVFASLGGTLKDSGGRGKGGGGVGFGGGESVDVGGLGTKGRGGGAGGYGTVRLGRKLEVAIDYSEEEDINVRGALDKALIERVIRRNLGQIQFCYDTKLQLTKRGKVSGRVMTSWRIAPSGRVVRTNIITSTMKDALFERCLQDRIRTWIFPEPKGGGSVRVEYPFIFRPSG